MSLEGEQSTDLYTFKDHISHMHIASPSNNRSFPSGEDRDDYKGFFEVIKEICPRDICISIEGRASEDFETCAKRSLEYLKRFV